MKKTLASIFSFGCLVASMSCANAFADEAVAKADAVLTDSAIVSLTAQLESRFTLSDTGAQNQFHFFQQIARLGVNINYGRVNAKIVANYKGNTTSGSSEAAPSETGEVGVREAWLSYSLMKKLTHYELTAQMGRFLPNSATTYGTDAVQSYWAGAGNFESTDGAALNLVGTEGIVNYTLQLGASTALPVWAFGPKLNYDTLNTGTVALGATDSKFGGAPTNEKMAYMASVQLNADLGNDLKAEGAFAYGARADTIMDDAEEGISTTTGVTQGDEAYFETSAGLHYKALAVGGWYSQLSFTGNDTVVYNTAYSSISSRTKTGDVRFITYGLGAQGDSSMFHVQDLWAKGDAFTYGVAFQWMAQTSEENKGTNGKDSLLSTASAGYVNGIFKTSLNYVYAKADDEVFISQGSTTRKSDTGQKLYVMTSISL